MKYLLALLIFIPSLAFSQTSRITATITITNRALTSNSFSVNSSFRYFTNATASGTVATNLTSVNATKTNLFNALAQFPVGSGVTLLNGNSSNFFLVGTYGGPMTLLVTGTWATVTYSTQSGPQTFTAMWPMENMAGAQTNKTNQGSSLVYGLGIYSTNAFPTNGNTLSNHLTKGASPQQYISSPVQFNGLLRAGAGGGVTNLFVSGGTNVNGTFSNLVNYGNAIRSDGAGGNSFQAGSNAQARGAFSMALGNGAFATNESMAIGNYSTAFGEGAMAFGLSAIVSNIYSYNVGSSAGWPGQYSIQIGADSLATNDYSTAVGTGSTADGNSASAFGTLSTSIGYGSLALGQAAYNDAAYGIAIGNGTVNAFSNSAAIGPKDHIGTGTTTTTTNQIVLGTANHRTYIPGTFNAAGISNLITITDSTNVIRGDWSTPWATVSTLANGANRLNMLTNSLINLSGSPSAAWTLDSIIYGVAAPRDGHTIRLRNNTGYAATIAHDSGLEAIAAYRITTATSTNVIFTNSATADLIYNAASSRWILWDVFDGTGGGGGSVSTNTFVTATNAILWMSGVGTNTTFYQAGSTSAVTVQPLIGNATNIVQVLDTNGVPFLFVNSNKVFSIASEARAQAALPGSTVFISGSNGSPLRLTLDTYNDSTSFGTLMEFRRTRGTAAVPTAILTNDVIMQLGAGGYGGTSNANSQGILAIKGSGTWTDLSRPTFFQFFTTPTNSVANSNRMEIQSFGRVDMYAGQTVKQITGLTNNVWEAQTTNGAPITYIRSNHTFIASNIVVTPIPLSMGGNEIPIAYRLFSLTNSVTITNVTAATSWLTNAMLGTNWIPGNLLTPGSTVRVRGLGYFTSASVTPCTFGMRSGNGLALCTNTLALASGPVNNVITFDCTLNMRTIGASGTGIAIGSIAYGAAAGTTGAMGVRSLQSGATAPATVTLDTTAPILIDWFITPGATTHGFTLMSCLAEIIP